MCPMYSRRSLFRLKGRRNAPGPKRSGHCLAFVEELHRRVLINREPLGVVRGQLGVDDCAAEGILKILRHCAGVPSQERIACIAMQDPGLDDNDVADICEMSVEWARNCRAIRDRIEASEVIPENLCWFAGHITRKDPTPEEIRVRSAEQRAKGHGTATRPRDLSPGVRQFFLWRSGSAPFFKGVG